MLRWFGFEVRGSVMIASFTWVLFFRGCCTGVVGSGSDDGVPCLRLR